MEVKSGIVTKICGFQTKLLLIKFHDKIFGRDHFKKIDKKMQRNFRCSARKWKVKMRRSVFHDSTIPHPQKKQLVDVQVSDFDIVEMSIVSPIVRQGWNSNKHVNRKTVSQRDNVLKKFLIGEGTR
jgi:hypothetical protein